MNEKKFTITKTMKKGRTPVLPFEQIKNSVLGKKYSLSLVFTGNALSRKLNREHRGIDKTANILSFPLSKNEGEIFINTNKAKKEASKFEMKESEFIGFLFIHGLLHLKGLKHSGKMEKEEIKFMKKFNIE